MILQKLYSKLFNRTTEQADKCQSCNRLYTTASAAAVVASTVSEQPPKERKIFISNGPETCICGHPAIPIFHAEPTPESEYPCGCLFCGKTMIKVTGIHYPMGDQSSD